jgi:intraflagellar transport protein 172
MKYFGQILTTLKVSQGAQRPFERYLFVTHLLALKEFCSKKKELLPFSAKQAISLLRYTDVLYPDRAFHEAGLLAKVRYVNSQQCHF